ncbi:hypothetical protein C1H46_021384 [Malus baccata]|uniref:Uncharacterized protein n=1 Tax=Malus baccata TaxID=106549 RepID=A0A540M2D2_MALBA|nr:hypothetical protein C1H46_021384 [Malus baccata]
MRAKEGLWPKIEEPFKQMDTAAKEVECFKALQKQERLAATHRINNIWEEVQNQKELERQLQKRYGNLVGEVERVQQRMDELRTEAEKHEIAARNSDLELAEAAGNVTENPDPVTASNELGNAVPGGASDGEATNHQIDGVQEQASTGPEGDMDIDAKKVLATPAEDVNLPDNMPSSVEEGDNVSDSVLATENLKEKLRCHRT